MKVRSVPSTLRGDRGFSLIELLVVVAVIAIMAAVAVPNIARYFRNYQIRAAAQQVASEIQTARAKAINKNVNFGVVFVLVDNVTYRYVIEDDMTNARTGARNTIAALIAANDPAQVGPPRLLPPGIRFGAGCAGFVANDSGFRYNRLGAWCDPGSTGCPALATGANLLMNPNAGTSGVTGAVGTTLCLEQPLTTLRRTVTVAPGGRVIVQR
jgi:prepilin-type N-terminal cleavage/methylation domain-containing protein